MIPLSSASMATPSVSAYGTLAGELFLYAGNRVAFESPLPMAAAASSSLSPSKCILLGGLSDGLMPVPYTQGLLEACQAEGWSLVQPILSSSYTGFGHGSLDRDATEIVELVHYLLAHRQAERVCFVGHSTGCQDICHFLRTQSDHPLWKRKGNPPQGVVRGAVLQAPVSDRQQPAAQDLVTYQRHVKTAQDMCAQDQGEEMMPRAAFWAPMTAQRMVDLQAVGGRDDYFSSDYTDEQLAERLQAAGDWPGLHMLVAFSGADEYVAAHIDSALLTERLTAALNTKGPVATPLYLAAPANHNLSQGNVGKFLEHVRQLLAKAKV